MYSSVLGGIVAGVVFKRVWKVAEPKNGKDFLIPLEGPVQEVIERRIGGITFQNNTRLGAAIRHAAAHLPQLDAVGGSAAGAGAAAGSGAAVVLRRPRASAFSGSS